MPELAEILPLLVPVLALLIPLIAVVSYFVVEPLAKAITRLAETTGSGRPATPGAGAAQLEDRIAALERAVESVLVEQRFLRELEAGKAARVGAARDDPGESSPSS